MLQRSSVVTAVSVSDMIEIVVSHSSPVSRSQWPTWIEVGDLVNTSFPIQF